jgi:hypothetical protein
VALAALLAGAGACGGGDSNGPSEESLVGTWVAAKAEFVSVANPSLKVDLIGLGGSIRLVLSSGHQFTLTIKPPGGAEEQSTGTWNSSGDEFVLRFAAGPLIGDMAFDVSLSGNTLTLTGADAEFDVDGQGGDEPAKLNLTMIRQ